MKSRTKVAVGVVMVVGGLVAAGAAAARRVDRGWAGGTDPSAPGDRILPAGEACTVVTDDGASLAVTVAGSGPTVVLAHCWMGARETWAPVAHRLIRSGHRVVLYDQRGHGSSTVGSDGLTIPRLGGDLRAVLEAVDARDAVLAGHSMGGMTIQSLAVHHPDVLTERTRAIVLVSTSARDLSGDTRSSRRTEATLGQAWIEPLLSSTMGHALVRGVFGERVHRDDLVLTRDHVVACAPEVRAGWFSAMARMDLVDGIASVAVPTTVMGGSRDTLTPPSRSDTIVAAIPGAALQTLSGYGHMLPLEAPDIVVATIRQHVSPLGDG